MLNRYIKAKDCHGYGSGVTLFMIAIVYLAVTASKIARRGIDSTFLSDAAFIFTFLVIGIWDYLHYRRLRKSNAETQRDIASQASLDEVKAGLTTDRLQSPNPTPIDEPLGITENTTRQLIDRDAP